MNAWLITWKWIGDFAKVRDPFIAILSARKSDRSVAEFVEYHYLLMTSSAREVAYFVNQPRKIPHKASKGMRINNLCHGDRITCGNNPFIYARKVSALVVSQNHNQAFEIIKWQEPPRYKWEDGSEWPTLAQDGEYKELIRGLKYPIDAILSQS